MRILFVLHDGVSHEPLGIEYLSASLKKKGHETKACMLSKAVETCGKWGADFVAFQVLSGDERRWGSCARAVKSAYPKIKTIFGGPHYLFFSKSDHDDADIIIRGDGEEAIVDAVEGRKHVDLSPIEDLDSIPLPDRGILYNDDFPGIKHNVIRNEIACRGCPYKCTYCYNSNKEWQKMMRDLGERLRYHSPERMCENALKTVKDYGGQLISFQDDIFGIDMKWLERFSFIWRRDVRIPFFAQFRPSLITEDRVKLLKEAGIHIASFAIESGNEVTRSEILDRHESNEMIKKGCAILHRYGIKFRMQNLLALPVEEPLKDAMETLRFNIECKPKLSWCSLLQAYPGTVIAEYVVRKKIVKSVDDLIPLVNATFFDESSLPIKDKKLVERLHKYWSAVVRWPWLYFLVTKILIRINFGKKIHNWIFNTTKQYINAREYWRVDHLEKHISILNRENPLDRLGGELERGKKEQDLCA